MTQEQEICLDAMKSWGEWENFGILAEESGEMLSAINKLFRGRASVEDVITELADVSLVITAFATYFDYDKFLAEKDRKLQRLKKRLEEWQKERDKQWLAEEHKHIFAKGRDSMKQQIMDNAVDGAYIKRQEWSEKDKSVLDALIRRLEGDNVYVSPHLAVECLKSIRHQSQWKPSDEQLEALEHSLGDYNIKIFEDRYEILKSLYNNLKKLKG